MKRQVMRGIEHTHCPPRIVVSEKLSKTVPAPCSWRDSIRWNRVREAKPIEILWSGALRKGKLNYCCGDIQMRRLVRTNLAWRYTYPDNKSLINAH
eukprot:SAG31_NODE_6882_length_1861_cov_1.677639_1_plen_96_part_00